MKPQFPVIPTTFWSSRCLISFFMCSRMSGSKDPACALSKVKPFTMRGHVLKPKVPGWSTSPNARGYSYSNCKTPSLGLALATCREVVGLVGLLGLSGLVGLVEPGEPLGEPGLGLGDFGRCKCSNLSLKRHKTFASLKWLNAEAEAKRLSIVISSKTGKPVLCLNRSLNLLNLVVTMRLLIKRSFFSKEFTSAIRSSTIFIKRTPRLFTSSAFTSKLKYRAQRTSCETSTPRISRRSKSMTMLQSDMKRGFIFSTSFWDPHVTKRVCSRLLKEADIIGNWTIGVKYTGTSVMSFRTAEWCFNQRLPKSAVTPMMFSDSAKAIKRSKHSRIDCKASASKSSIKCARVTPLHFDITLNPPVVTGSLMISCGHKPSSTHNTAKCWHFSAHLANWRSRCRAPFTWTNFRNKDLHLKSFYWKHAETNYISESWCLHWQSETLKIIKTSLINVSSGF